MRTCLLCTTGTIAVSVQAVTTCIYIHIFAACLLALFQIAFWFGYLQLPWMAITPVLRVGGLRRLEVVSCSMAHPLLSSPPQLLHTVEHLDLSHHHISDGIVFWLAGLQLHAHCVLQLEGLSSASLLTDAAVSHIASAPWLSQLSELSLSGQGQLGANAGPWKALVERAPGALRCLNLSACHSMGVAVAAELGRAEWVVRLPA